MRIAYLSTDDVNAALAVRIAADCGLDLCQVAPQGAAPDGEFGGAVYDLDFLPAGRLGRLLADLGAGRVPHPVAVHGYNLGTDQALALDRLGVLVYRCLEAGLFEQLRAAACRRPARPAPAGDRPRPVEADGQASRGR
jgi:hypothetical protein